MLSFSILEIGNVSEYCSNLSSILTLHNVKATVFFVGRGAEQNPEAVSCLSNACDIGSQTYSYVDLTSIPDYTVQLDEVERGKQAVDSAGDLCSKLFKAPYGSTDENIYSLLGRSEIIADFSYEDHYNIYENGHFVRFEAAVYEGSNHTADFFLTLPETDRPLIIDFDNTYSTSNIDFFLSRLKTGKIEFVTASEVAGTPLTIRGG